MGEMLKVLGGFHHRVAQRIKGMTGTYGAGGEWDYPPVVAEMEAVVLQPISEYIKRRQATISETVAFRPIYELCAEAERMPGTIRVVIWWYQDAVNEPEE